MDIDKTFRFLVDKYHLSYSHQVFYHCYGGNWAISTHSYYNETGCFTIHLLHQRNELDFYFSKAFSNIREILCEHKIDEQSLYPEIWFEAKKKLLFPYRPQLYLTTLAQTIKKQIEEKGAFWGIKVF